MELQPPQQRRLRTTWNILIIDDDEDDYLLTREMLNEAKGQKHKVAWASTFEEGREALFSGGFDAILVDYDLGLYTGIDLIREATERGFDSPLILFTGRGDYQVDVEAMQAGATLYLTKGEANPLLLERIIRYAIERKQSEEDLRKSEERFHKAFNATPNAQVISRMEDGQILIISDGFEQLFGYSRAEMIGKSTLELNMYVNPADREEAVRLLKANNHLRDFEVQIRTKTGEVRQAKLSIEMISIDDELLMFAVFRDITEHKRAEEARRELFRSLELDRGRLAAVLDHLPVGVWIADQNGQLIGKNEQADRIWAGEVPLVDGITEYPQYAAWYVDSGVMLQPEDYPVAKALRTAERVEPVALRIRRFDGTEGTVLVSAVPITDDQNRLVGAVGVNVDITDQHQAEETLERYAEQLARSNQDLEKFAFVASHDLQEPLHKIVRFGELLKRSLGDRLDANSAELLRRMQNGAARMQVMIRDLLDLSQVESQGRPFVWVDLHQSMLEVISDLEPKIEQTQAQVKLDPLPSIQADPVQMRQLLQNMLSNALKFHKSGQPPQVRITAHTQSEPNHNGQMISLKVSDQGIGFDMQYFERILEPFQRLHGLEYEGSGMGMAICKRIVERHRGHIKAQSSPGSGTTFIVTLPLTQPE